MLKSLQGNSHQIMKEELSKGVEEDICFYFVISENILLPSSGKHKYKCH
jgi:hypothetical protein